MADQESCPSASSCGEKSCEGCKAKGGTDPFRADLNPHSSIKKVYGVMSGKGGVGKSFVTGHLAAHLRKKGLAVGILDADITGPSIPRMYGLTDLATGNDGGEIYPVEAGDGTKVISMNVLTEDPEAPVVWRGPVIAGAVKQFWTDVVWGDLDVLLVDMPPGTGDVPLTLFQSLPIDGVVLVTSPQDLVGMIVKKAWNMAGLMKVPVLGIVENYSYFLCPDCGKKHPVFGKGGAKEAAESLDIPLLAELPLDPSAAEAVDRGDFYLAPSPLLAAASDRLAEGI